MVMRLYSSQFVQSVLALSVANAAAKAIALIAMPIITRLYSPAELGIFGVYTGWAVLLLSVSSLRYEFSVPLGRGDRDGQIAVVYTLAINLLFSSLALALVLLILIFAGETYGIADFAKYAWVVPLLIAGGGSYRAFNYWAVRRGEFKSVAWTKLTQSVTGVVVQIGAGLLGYGVVGLILGQFFSFAAGTMRLSRSARILKLLRSWSRRNSLRAIVLLKRYARLPLYDVPATLMTMAGSQLPNILIAPLFGATSAGLYLLAERILITPLGLLALAIGQVLFAKSREVAFRRSLAEHVARVAGLLGIASLVGAVIVYYSAEWVFGHVFGSEWLRAGVFASWLSFGFGSYFVYSSISMVLQTSNGQHISFYINSVILAAKAALVVCCYLYAGVDAFILGISGINFVGYGLAVVVIIMHLRTISFSSGATR